MNKKKLLSIICALAMTASVATSFTVVSADEVSNDAVVTLEETTTDGDNTDGDENTGDDNTDDNNTDNGGSTATTDATRGDKKQETAAPTLEVVERDGLVFGTPTVSADYKTITVAINWKNVDGVSSGKISVVLPENATGATISGFGTQAVTDGVYSGTFAWVGSDVKTTSTGTIGTMTIELSEALTEDVQLAFSDGAYLFAQDGETMIKIGTNGVEASKTVVYGPAVVPPTEAITIPAGNVITVPSDLADTITDSVSKFFLDVTVKVNNTLTTIADYGKKFIAKYNNTELTAVQYENLINGYTDAIDGTTISSIADVVNNLSFVAVYSENESAPTSFSVSANLVETGGDNNIVVNPDDEEVIISNNGTPAFTKFDGNSKIAQGTETVTLTATLANSTDTEKDVVFTITDGTTVASFVAPTTDEGVETQTADSATVKTVALSGTTATATVYLDTTKTGTFKVTASYAYTDTSSLAKTVTKDATFKVVAKSTSGGSTGDGDSSGSTTTTTTTSGGGGATIIASGNVGINTNNTTTTTTSYKPNFNDLDSVSWAAEAINGLASRGMINGRDQYTFDPNANITRAEYCQILMGAINTLNATGSSTFNDVAQSDWYYNAVSVASQLGIVSGYGDGNFGPNDLISRQDMAVMTYRTAQIMNKSLEPVNASVTFADSNLIADYAFEAVMTLQKAGIINGMTETEFAPLANATRAQSAKVIYDTFVK